MKRIKPRLDLLKVPWVDLDLKNLIFPGGFRGKVQDSNNSIWNSRLLRGLSARQPLHPLPSVKWPGRPAALSGRITGDQGLGKLGRGVKSREEKETSSMGYSPAAGTEGSCRNLEGRRRRSAGLQLGPAAAQEVQGSGAQRPRASRGWPL
jgi:hypothetical protein